jgi:hypothetical protein
VINGGAVFARKVQSEPIAAKAYVDTATPVLKVTLLGSRFSNNAAKHGSGGAVNVDGAHLMLGEGVEFWHNTAAADGGALAIYAVVSSQMEAYADVTPGCISTWDQDIAALNISQQGVVFNGNEARGAGGAGFIGKGVQCNTGTVLLQNRAAAHANKAASSSVFYMPGLCDAGHEWRAAVSACVKCNYGSYKLHADVNTSTTCTSCPPIAGYLCLGGDDVRPLPHY